jgi:hypothetical protein
LSTFPKSYFVATRSVVDHSITAPHHYIIQVVKFDRSVPIYLSTSITIGTNININTNTNTDSNTNDASEVLVSTVHWQCSHQIKEGSGTEV